jgi:hypothetical protein
MGAKLLIAAGAVAVNPADLPFGIRSLIEAADEIFVVSPTLPTRIDWITSDTDRAKVQADERLEALLGQLDELGASAEGAVGADDPLVALEDALRSFAPDHLLIGLREGGQAGWQEKGLLDQIERRFAIPMTVFQLPSGRSP